MMKSYKRPDVAETYHNRRKRDDVVLSRESPRLAVVDVQTQLPHLSRQRKK